MSRPAKLKPMIENLPEGLETPVETPQAKGPKGRVAARKRALKESYLAGLGDQADISNQKNCVANGTGGDFTALQSTISAVVELWRRRQAWHRAEKALTLTGKSLCRRLSGGDADLGKELYSAVLKDQDHPLKTEAILSCGPLIVAQNNINEARTAAEKQLANLAKQLPGYDFIEKTPGISAFTLYSLTAECAGVNNRGFLDFDTISRVFKRMSVHCLPDGTRARLLPGVDAVEAGYAPKRRSVLWTIGDSLIKTSDGPYRKLYDEFKANEIIKAEAKGLTVIESAKIPKGEKDQFMSKAHVHNRAKRLMEKELLRDLWKHIRRQFGMSVTPPSREEVQQMEEIEKDELEPSVAD